MREDIHSKSYKFCFVIFLCALHSAGFSQLSHSYNSTKPATKNFADTLSGKVISFSASLKNDHESNLRWVAVSEYNLNHYEVERSDDGINFYKTFDFSVKNLNADPIYTFRDPSNIYGTVSYRLRMLYNDGSFAYSHITLVTSKNIPFGIKYVNNPFSNKLRIEYFLPEEGLVKLQVFNNFYQRIIHRSLTGIKGYNNNIVEYLSNLPKGMYLLKLSDRQNTTSKRVIKI